MAKWTPQDWMMFFTALGTLVTAIFAALATYQAAMAKIKSVETSDKIDHNTKITEEGVTEAVKTAKTASEKAGETREITEQMSKQLNGKLEEKIIIIVKEQLDPVVEIIKEHAAQDDKNMAEIRQTLTLFVSESKMKEFSDYVRQRNHDILNTMNQQTLKMELILKRLEGK